MNTHAQTLTPAPSTDAPSRGELPGVIERRLVNPGFRLASALRRRALRAGRSRASPASSTALGWSRRRERRGSAAITDSTASIRCRRSSARSRSGRMKRSGTTSCAQLPRLREPHLAGPHSVHRALERHDPGADEVHSGFLGDGAIESAGSEHDAGLALGSRPGSRLFHGRICVLGRLDRISRPVAPGVFQGDLSGIAAVEVPRLLRPTRFLRSSWRSNQTGTARSRDWPRRPPTSRSRSLSGVPSWLLEFFERVLERTGKSRIAEVWPQLELVVHGGVKFDPYRQSFRSLVGSNDVAFQEVYPSSEGFIAFGDPATGLLRLAFDHGIFYEFVPVDELDSPRPSRHWLGTVGAGCELRDRRLDLRGHVGSSDRRYAFGSSRLPLRSSRSPDAPATRSRPSAST